MSRMVWASFSGSAASGGFGRPWATSQKLQRRVQTSPRIMKVAVPWLKHSWMFGQLASSQTVTSRFSRSLALSLATALPAGMRTRIHSGLRNTGAAASKRTGLRAILSPPSCFTPTCSDAGAASAATGMSPMTGRTWIGIVFDMAGVGRGGGPGGGGGGGHDRRVAGAAAVAHRRHPQALVAAGIDALERRQVHGHVEGQSVEGAAVAHPQAQRADLGIPDVDARCTRAAGGGDVPRRQRIDDRLL